MSFPCPECGGPTRVHNTTPLTEGIQRGRRCVDCSAPFTTLEMATEARPRAYLVAAEGTAQFTRDSLTGLLEREEERIAQSLASIRTALRVQLGDLEGDIRKVKGALGGD